MVSPLPSVIHEGLCRRCPSLVQPEFSLSAKSFLARALGWKSPVASMTQDKSLSVGHPWSLPCGVALELFPYHATGHLAPLKSSLCATSVLLLRGLLRNQRLSESHRLIQGHSGSNGEKPSPMAPCLWAPVVSSFQHIVRYAQSLASA